MENKSVLYIQLLEDFIYTILKKKKMKMNLFQSILYFSNCKIIFRSKLCNNLWILALPLTF